MLKFERLIIITGNKYSIRTDTIQDLADLFQGSDDVNKMIILVISNGQDLHSLDVGRIIIANPVFLTAANIDEFIDMLTPELIYTYRSSLLTETRYMRSFRCHDLSGDTVISPFNIITGETTTTSYDRHFTDLLISCEAYDLTNVIPIIDGKLRLCSWGDKKIQIQNQVELTRSTAEVNFLSLGEVNVSLIQLGDIEDNDWVIPDDRKIILVIGGTLFYNDPHVFNVNCSQNKLKLNTWFMNKLIADMGYSSMEAMINDQDSFVIAIEAKRLLIRDVLMIPVCFDMKVLEFCYFEEDSQDDHVDYICIDNADRSVKGITITDKMYKNVISGDTPKTHHIHIDSGSGDMRLVQLLACV